MMAHHRTDHRDQSLRARFLRDDRGNVFVLFALALIPLLAAIGLAVDGSRGFTVRTELRNALDAAGLAVARDFSTQTALLGPDPDAAEYFDAVEAWAADFVNEYLAANFDEGFFSSTTVASDTTVVDIVLADGDQGQLSLTARTTMPTYLLGLVEVDTVNVTVSGTYTIGGTGGTVEVALVIDNSGSTVWGNVVAPLQNAVTSMLDELIPCESGQTNCSNSDVHVSLIPFRAHMRLPTGTNASYLSTWSHAITGSPEGVCVDPRYSTITDVNDNDIHDPLESVDLCGTGTLRNLGDECVVGREHQYFDYFLTNLSQSQRDDFGTHYSQIRDRGTSGNLVLNHLLSPAGGLNPARWPAAALDYYHLSHLDDAPPLSADESGQFLPRFRAANGYLAGADESDYTADELTYQRMRYRPNSDSYRHEHDETSCSANEIVGPTSNRQDIEDEMAEWSPDGGTSMDVGLAWGWRALSPRWQGRWGIGNDLPREYDASGNTKTIVMVTDSVAGQVARNVAMSCPIDRTAYGSTEQGYECSRLYPYHDGYVGSYWSYPDIDTSSGTVTDLERQQVYTQYFRHQISMLLVCEQIRAEEIEMFMVYLLPDSTGDTTYLGLQSESRETYQACATQPDDSHARTNQDYYFEVSSEEELSDVFASIGRSLSSLRISQ